MPVSDKYRSRSADGRRRVIEALRAPTLIGAGVLAGVLVAVDVAVVPTFRSLSAAQWIERHKAFDERIERFMPPQTIVTMILGGLVVAFERRPAVRGLAALGLLLLMTSGVTSQTQMVPINRKVKSWDPAAPPPEWAALRARWAKMHKVRLLAAMGGLSALALSATVADLAGVVREAESRRD
jgi:uncharacterized membrane protein